MKKSRLFIINSLIVITSSLLIRVITSTFDIYLANKIGAEAIGVFGLISSIYMFTITLATSGINLATTKVLSEEIEKNNNENIPYVIKKAFLYSSIMGILAAILLILFAKTICTNWLMDKIPHYVLYILALSLPFVSMTSAISGYFLAIRNVLRTSISQMFSQLIRIGIIYILIKTIFTNSLNYSILALVIANTLAEIISCVFLYITYLKNKKKINNVTQRNPALTQRLFKISIPIAITSYIRSGLNTLKQILIPLRLKLSGLSYETAIVNYGIICGMAMPIIMFPSVIVYSYSSLLVPEFSRYSVDLDKNKMNKDICKLFKITLYFSIGITGILMFYGKSLGNILFENDNVGWYIKIIAPLITLIYLDNVIDSILKGLGKQISVMCCNILDLVISVSFIYFLLPIFGTVGYIIVLYISEILNYTISVMTLFKETNLKFRYFEWVFLPIIYIIISILLTNIFIFSYLNTSLALVLKITLCVLFYICLIVITQKQTV